MRLAIKIMLFFTLMIYSSNHIIGQYFYIPDNDTNVMELKDQGDLNISLQGFRKNRLNLQLAYSPIKNISISAAFFRHQQKQGDNFRISSNTKGYSFSGSLGFHRYINKLEKHNFFLTNHMKGVLIHANLGYSKGFISNDLAGLYLIDLNHQNIFFRTGITLDYKIISASFSTRYLSLDFQKGDVIGNINEIDWFLIRLQKDVEEKDPRLLRETLFRIKFHIKRFDLYADYNTIRGKNERDLRSAFFVKETYNLGVIFKIFE